jgi:prolyl-tRNA synthetase
VIVPIYKNEAEKSAVLETVERVRKELGAFRVKVDDRSEVTPGFKFNDWEMRGVPLRIELGPKDLEKESVALARRDLPGKAGKSFIPQANLAPKVAETLGAIHTSLYERALAFRLSHTCEPETYAALVEAVQDGWAFSWWCESPQCEAKVKEDTKATTRCIPLDQPDKSGRCIVCGEPARRKVYFARAY